MTANTAQASSQVASVPASAPARRGPRRWGSRSPERRRRTRSAAAKGPQPPDASRSALRRRGAARDADGERRGAAVRARRLDRPSQKARVLERDRESEPEPPALPRAAAIGLEESVEEMRQSVGGDPRSAVRHGEPARAVLLA